MNKTIYTTHDGWAIIQTKRGFTIIYPNEAKERAIETFAMAYERLWQVKSGQSEMPHA